MKAVISLGNPLKSDDNIGNIILEKLEIKNINKINVSTTPENFIKELKKYNKIIILDALEFGGDLGEVRLFELDDVENIISTTHNISINLIKKFLSDSDIKIIGIQPKKIEIGTGLSEELEESLDKIVTNVERIINSL